MNTNDHYRQLRESLAVIEESIEKGLLERQRNIGFNTSAACADMLEILLHKLNLIDPGFVIKHEWFNSKNKLIEKFPVDFPRKSEIFTLIPKIEEKRNQLCYGKPQKIEVIQDVLSTFNQLKQIFREVGVNEL